jgi:predicted outer membrane repeat protein
LQNALNAVVPGGTVELTTSGISGNVSTYYDGGFTLETTGTSVAHPVTIEPMTGVTDPILDGNRSNTILTVDGLDNEIFAFLKLTGLTFQNGNGGFGGGIANNDGGTLTISDCTFTGNSGYGDGSGTGGGAIDNADGAGIPLPGEGGGTTTIDNSAFVDNMAVDGGAIDNADGNAEGAVTVDASTFAGNLSEDGGAIDDGDNGALQGLLDVSNSSFSGNSSGVNGGAIDVGDHHDVDGSSSLILDSSTFSGNTAVSGSGGAIDSGDDGGLGFVGDNGSTFTDNKTEASTSGGAVSQNAGGFISTGSTFIGNSTLGSGGAVGGTAPGGGGAGDERGGFGLNDDTLRGNMASFGGAVAADYCNGGLAGDVESSTLSDNSAADGGAISVGTGNCASGVIVQSSTLEHNVASERGGAIYGGPFATDLVSVRNSTLASNSALVTGNGDAIGGQGDVLEFANIFTTSCSQPQGSGAGTWNDFGYNVGTDASCFSSGSGDTHASGSQLIDQLGPLANNGGPTLTMVLSPSNPADSLLPATQCTFFTDQRGVDPEPGSNCDAGAVQLSQQAIAFTSTLPADTYVSSTPEQLSATGGGSGLPVTFSSNTPEACTVSGSQVTLNAIGTCTVAAEQAGDDYYVAAPTAIEDITVVPPQPYAITSPPTLPTATTGSPYSITLAASGGAGNAGPAQWILSSGSLPPGLTLNPDGTISGTPTSAGTYSFQASVGDPVTATFTLVVAAPPTAPSPLSGSVGAAGASGVTAATVALAFTGASLLSLIDDAGALIAGGFLILTAARLVRRRKLKQISAPGH